MAQRNVLICRNTVDMAHKNCTEQEQSQSSECAAMENQNC